MSSSSSSNVVSRRPSVEKAQHGGLGSQHGGLGSLDRDATLSWHNSFFDNTTAANDMVPARLTIHSSVFMSRGTLRRWSSVYWRRSAEAKSDAASIKSPLVVIKK